jgi:uncharacterized protein (TIGR03086 family)
VPELEDLARAHRQFASTLGGVTSAQWTQTTPCEGWEVGDLLAHVVGGEHLTMALLDGAARDDAIGVARNLKVLPDKVQAQFADAATGTEDAFAVPGALERIVHHPVGDLPAAQMLGFRISDLTVHSWDLARATGGDERLDPVLVSTVWEQLQPMAAIIHTVGVFGAGPSGEVPDDADLQRRLLDLTGRRP